MNNQPLEPTDAEAVTERAAELERDAARWAFVKSRFQSYFPGQYPGYAFQITMLLKPAEGSPTLEAAVDAGIAADAAFESERAKELAAHEARRRAKRGRV